MLNTGFNNWWNEDLLTEDNPHVDGTSAFWAWEGWCAAVKAERGACATMVDHILKEGGGTWGDAIRARSQK